MLMESDGNRSIDADILCCCDDDGRFANRKCVQMCFLKGLCFFFCKGHDVGWQIEEREN